MSDLDRRRESPRWPTGPRGVHPAIQTLWFGLLSGGFMACSIMAALEGRAQSREAWGFLALTLLLGMGLFAYGLHLVDRLMGRR
jgi:hypothetical protein